MSKVHWHKPEFPEAGGFMTCYANNIYCEWEADLSKQKLIVTLPLQGATVKKSLKGLGIDEMDEAQLESLFVNQAKDIADNYYSLPQLHDDLKRIPTKKEVNRLIATYPSFYDKPYRKDFLYQLLSGTTHAEMADSLMNYDGKNPTGGNKGKAVQWTKKKAKKMALRLLYLQFVEDDKMSREYAVSKIMDWYPHLTNATTRNNIMKATLRPSDK